MIVVNAVRVDQWAWRCRSPLWKNCVWLYCADIECHCAGFLVESGDVSSQKISSTLEGGDVLWYIIGTNDKIENADPMKIYEYCDQHSFQNRS